MTKETNGSTKRIAIYVAGGILLLIFSQWYLKVDAMCLQAQVNASEISGIKDDVNEIKENVRYLVRRSKRADGNP
jgi:hypothetical protein